MMQYKSAEGVWIVNLVAAFLSQFPLICVAEEPTQYTIDYIVFYTPDARANEEDGSVAAMDARIARAFSGANEIFQQSNTGIQLRLVATKELSRSNSQTSLETVTTELVSLPEVTEEVKKSGADSYAIIVERMMPGAYAGIPLSIRQAQYGGASYFGRINFTGFTFAHETGHTLGAFHDRPAELSASTELPPDSPYGSHFIGISGQHWRSVMSVKQNSYLAGPGQTIPTLQSQRFSGPNTFWDGVPTGVSGRTDVVGTFRYYVPFVSQAGELRSRPPVNEEPPPGSDVPPGPTPDPSGVPGQEEDVVRPVEELLPAIKLIGKPLRKGNSIEARIRCYYSKDSSPAVGKRLVLQYSAKGKPHQLKLLSCPRSGVATFRFGKRGYRKGMTITYQGHPVIKVSLPFNRQLLRN